ncbi:helix-turn-helix domain-containing protein [Amycolatopsis sp. NPDC051061]|uniref:helix-turn-helix domain-containing protein n=1 Tax=Amycolatopsis sp. NPDC051061 TaxID=3155042 RepID=UPI00343D6F6B
MQTDHELARQLGPTTQSCPENVVHEGSHKPGPADASQLLYTPAAAAERLTIGESWLRRKAGQRLIPCTFVGKHLRFTEDDLRAIVAAGRRGPSHQNQAPSRPSRRRRTRR